MYRVVEKYFVSVPQFKAYSSGRARGGRDGGGGGAVRATLPARHGQRAAQHRPAAQRPLHRLRRDAVLGP